MPLTLMTMLQAPPRPPPAEGVWGTLGRQLLVKSGDILTEQVLWRAEAPDSRPRA